MLAQWIHTEFCRNWAQAQRAPCSSPACTIAGPGPGTNMYCPTGGCWPVSGLRRFAPPFARNAASTETRRAIAAQLPRLQQPQASTPPRPHPHWAWGVRRVRNRSCAHKEWHRGRGELFTMRTSFIPHQGTVSCPSLRAGHTNYSQSCLCFVRRGTSPMGSRAVGRLCSA